MPKKNLQYYRKQPYRMELFFDREDQVWFVRYPELPGCDADGETPEEAIAAGEEAKSLWLADTIERRQPVPEPRMEPSHSGKLVLRLPKSLHAAAARAAEEEGVSLNTYLAQIVAEGVQRSGFQNLVHMVEGALQKAFRRLFASGAPAYKLSLLASVEPIYGEEKRPLPEEELEKLPSQPPPAQREHHA